MLQEADPMTISSKRFSASILVIEDDELVTSSVKDILEDDRLNVNIPNDGEGGIDAALRRRPDCILLDVSMPKLNGFQVLESLKTDLRTKQIPVVMLTSHSQMEDVQKAVSYGAKGYIVKPINTELLIQKIQFVVRTSL